MSEKLNRNFNVFLGDSTDHFTIEFELNRLQDLMICFTPIVFAKPEGVSSVVQAWSSFRETNLLKVQNLDRLYYLTVTLNMPPISVYVFGNISRQDAYWLREETLNRRLAWIECDDSGSKSLVRLDGSKVPISEKEELEIVESSSG